METEVKKKLKKKWIFIPLAAVAAVLLVLVVMLYNAWENPASVFIQDAVSSRAQINVPSQLPVIDENGQETGQSKQAALPAPTHTAFSDQNIVNVLLMGIDTSEAREARNMSWRSDMIILCTVNFKKNSIVLTSIPRDTQTYIYHIDENGNATNIQMTKLNSGYSYGLGPDKYGAQNEMQAVHDFLSNASGMDIPVNYYVSIDLDNAPKLADAMGGIPITLDVDFPDLGKKGDNVVITSSNADAFLQNRKQIGGDIDRGHHHEQFLISLAQQIKKKGAVSSAAGLFSLITQYVKTNLNFTQTVAMASVLDNFDLGSLDYKTIDGYYKYINQLDFYIADKSDVKSRMEYLMQ